VDVGGVDAVVDAGEGEEEGAVRDVVVVVVWTLIERW
jgi:hypothetical protein